MFLNLPHNFIPLFVHFLHPSYIVSKIIAPMITKCPIWSYYNISLVMLEAFFWSRMAIWQCFQSSTAMDHMLESINNDMVWAETSVGLSAAFALAHQLHVEECFQNMSQVENGCKRSMIQKHVYAWWPREKQHVFRDITVLSCVSTWKSAVMNVPRKAVTYRFVPLAQRRIMLHTVFSLLVLIAYHLE